MEKSTFLAQTPRAGTRAPLRRYGSPHPGGCLFALCDGSVRSIGYSVDATTHARLANRADGQVIDASKIP